MDEDCRRLLTEARQDLAAVAEEISEAVSLLERGDGVAVEDLLGEALSRVKTLDARLERHLRDTG